jgi:hypothetical protein
MSQLLLPLIPSGASIISGSISVFLENDTWTYFHGLCPVFSHHKDDLSSFKMFTASLVDQGACHKPDIARCFGVSESLVKRALLKLRQDGPRSFFVARKSRTGAVFTKKVLEDVQEEFDSGASRSEICKNFSIKRSTLKKAITSGRLREPVVLTAGTNSKAQRTIADASCAMGTACHRADERILAAMGKLNGATTVFESCTDLKFGGVLCALPFLEANGLFKFLNIYFSLEPKYYTVLHVVQLLAFMALARIKTAESLRFESPGELGKLLGLDRVPEVKTLRNKVGKLCNESNTKEWMLALSKFHMEQNELMAGVFYIDGHVRIYSGSQTKLPRRFVSRQRLCLRGTTDYYVNDALGEPFFVISKTVNEGMIAALEESIIPQLLLDAPGLPTEEELEANPYLHRFIIVVDREASSWRLFKKLWNKYRIACISYQKSPCGELWDEGCFEESTVTMPGGEIIDMKLSEQGTYLGNKKDGLWVKEIRKQTQTSHQTSIITTGYLLAITTVPAFMFSRWTQENFFGYMMAHYNLDRIIDYGVEEFPDPNQKVVNPEHRRLDKQVNSLNSKLCRKLAEFAFIELEPEIGSGKTMETRLATKAQLCEVITYMKSELTELKAKRKQHSKHITFRELPEEEQFQQLAPSRKTFIDTIKMVCYRSETAMANTLKQTVSRADDVRRLACEIMRSEADIHPDSEKKILNITLHRMGNPQADRAVQQMLYELNETETAYPGTSWKMVFALAGTPDP